MQTFLDYAAQKYFKGEPILSDEEWDRLADKYHYVEVGFPMNKGIPHHYRMYSLQKCFNLMKPPFRLDEVCLSPKLDGAAVSLLYENGVLRLALTRGDGIKGQDITDKMQFLVPTRVDVTWPLQITGEVVAPSSIPNARNYAAGALNLKSTEDFSFRDLYFFGYEMQPYKLPTYDAAMAMLRSLGFRTAYLDDCSKFPTDGTVYRINSYEKFESMGYTAHHPKGAFALKTQKQGKITTLVDVEWQVGKSGVVSPVAILEPVDIEGATVSRATLHNINYIRSLDLKLGCQVEVIRSGDIIPRIVRRVDL
mgnify:CR=1 FL=1|jgi:DNA ligase (NAD+)